MIARAELAGICLQETVLPQHVVFLLAVLFTTQHVSHPCGSFNCSSLVCDSPHAVSDGSLQCGGNLQQLLSISLMCVSSDTVKCLPAIDLAMIGLERKADASCCPHKETCLPRLRHYPMQGHWLLWCLPAMSWQAVALPVASCHLLNCHMSACSVVASCSSHYQALQWMCSVRP